MKVREYLERLGGKCNEVTFIKARARKDAHTPLYHAEYQVTSIHTVSEWAESKIMDYLILNDKQSPIDWLLGSTWKSRFDKGELLSMLVISKEDLETMFSPEQAAETIEHIDKQLEESLKKAKSNKTLCNA